jgi:hypothetical protein
VAEASSPEPSLREGSTKDGTYRAFSAIRRVLRTRYPRSMEMKNPKVMVCAFAVEVSELMKATNRMAKREKRRVRITRMSLQQRHPSRFTTSSASLSEIFEETSPDELYLNFVVSFLGC